MKYVTGVKDWGIVMSPDKPGEPNYDVEGGGIREAILNKVGDTYYVFYDGAKPGAAPDSYWCACLAKSTDLVHWEKLGKMLDASVESHPENGGVYMDAKSASSPWVFQENGIWYMFYVGCEEVSPNGIPAAPYHTLLATADSIEGPWKKANEEPGMEKSVCFFSRKNQWNNMTSSPGHVLQNPKWEGEGDTEHEKYFMFFSGATAGPPVFARSIGIARTNDLSVHDNWDAENPNHWKMDEKPLLPFCEDLENASIYYEESNGYYFMFVNRVHDNAYTNAVWVYWSKDLEHWNVEDKAVVLDKTNCTWAKGTIGLGTVVKKDDNTLAMLYDAEEGDGTGFLNRQLGFLTIALPLDPKNFQ